MGQNSGHSSHSFTLKVLPIPPPICFPDSTLVTAALGQKGSVAQWFNGLTRAAPCQSPLQTATYSPPQMQILGCSLTSHPLPVAFTSESRMSSLLPTFSLLQSCAIKLFGGSWLHHSFKPLCLCMAVTSVCKTHPLCLCRAPIHPQNPAQNSPSQGRSSQPPQGPRYDDLLSHSDETYLFRIG